MFSSFLLVALGGALGSVLRYACSLWIGHLSWQPWVATLIVNVVGSFLIGVVAGSSTRGGWLSFASVGFCGGFTTLSTFSLQNVVMLQKSNLWGAAAYTAGTLAICMLATLAGLWVGQQLKR